MALARAPLEIADRAAMSTETVDVIFGSGTLIVAALWPFFFPRWNLEPRQFAQFPATPAGIAGALLVTSPVTWPFLWSLVWAGAMWFFRYTGTASPLLLGLALILALIIAVVFSRVASAVSSLFFESARAASLRTILGVLIVLAALPLALFFLVPNEGAQAREALTDAAASLSWTPFGAPFAILAAAETVDSAVTLARLGIVCAAVAVLVGLWFSLATVALTRIPKPSTVGIIRRGVGWFGRVPARPAAIIGARLATYWGRDPRYRVSLLAIPFAPLLIMAVLFIGGVNGSALALIPVPVILLLLAWMTHNDVAADSTAFWLHVASGTKGRHDRVGRLFPVLLIGIPVLLLGTSLSVAIVGDWRIAPSIFALNSTALAAGSATAAITSVLFPYPTTRPGDSPFLQPQWQGIGSGVSQTASLVGAILLVLPVLLPVLQSVLEPTLAGQFTALAFGMVYAAVVATIGIAVGGLIFQRRAPEILAKLQMFD